MKQINKLALFHRSAKIKKKIKKYFESYKDRIFHSLK